MRLFRKRRAATPAAPALADITLPDERPDPQPTAALNHPEGTHV